MSDQRVPSNGHTGDDRAAAAADDRKAVLMRFDNVLQNLTPSRIRELRLRTDALDAALLSALDAVHIVATKSPAQVRIQAEAALLGSRQEPMSLSEARLRYATFGSPGEAVEKLLSAQEFADKVHVKSKQTVMNWIDKHRVVAWRSAKNAYCLPADQIDDAGRLVPGLEQVMPLFDDGYLCWLWLTRPLGSLGGRSPLAHLKKGSVDKVRAAAAAFNDGAFG